MKLLICTLFIYFLPISFGVSEHPLDHRLPQSVKLLQTGSNEITPPANPDPLTDKSLYPEKPSHLSQNIKELLVPSKPKKGFSFSPPFIGDIKVQYVVAF